MNAKFQKIADEMIANFKAGHPGLEVIQSYPDWFEEADESDNHIKMLVKESEVKLFKFKVVKDMPEIGLKAGQVYEIGYFNPGWDPDCPDEAVRYFEDCLEKKYNTSFFTFYDETDISIDSWVDEDCLIDDYKENCMGRLWRTDHGSVYDLASRTVDHSKNDEITDENVVWLNMLDSFDCCCGDCDDYPVEDINLASITRPEPDPEMAKIKGGGSDKMMAGILGHLANRGTQIVGIAPGASVSIDLNGNINGHGAVDITNGFKSPEKRLEDAKKDPLFAGLGDDAIKSIIGL